MSSIRSSHWPFRERASKKLATAASNEPKCNGPVGEGANRPTYSALPVAIVPVSELAFR